MSRQEKSFRLISARERKRVGVPKRRQIYCVCVCFSWEDSQESCAGGMRKSPCDILPFCSLLPVAFRGLRRAFMVLPEECQWFFSPDGCPPSASWCGSDSARACSTHASCLLVRRSELR